MNNLLIIGAGGHGKSVADAASLLNRWDEIAFIDDIYPQVSNVMGYSVIGTIQELQLFLPQYCDAIVAIGDNRLRIQIIQKIVESGFNIVSIFHPSATISSFAQVAPGTVALANSAINACAQIGLGGIVNTGATVGHDCIIGDGVHVASGANIAGGVRIGNYSWIGIGTAIIQELSIGEGAVIGAGSVLIRNVPDNVLVVGNPGRVIKELRGSISGGLKANLSFPATYERM